MKKIVVRMRGGLGNQLFIMCFAYYVVKFLKLTDYEIVLDNREYENYKIRDFEILKLLNDKNIRLYEEDKDKSLKYEISRRFFHLLQKVLPRKIPILKIFSVFGLLYTRSNSKIKKISNNHNIYYIYGYFQDERIVKEVKDILLEKINTKFTDKFLDNTKSNIAVSIRWGDDYATQGWPICSKEYYTNAIKEIIEKKYKTREINVLVFSDELQKAKEANIYKDAIYIENRSSIEQIKLMMCCDDFIISNSSFSWFGSYLGMKNDSIVISPDYWYNFKHKTADSYIYFPKLEIRNIK